MNKKKILFIHYSIFQKERWGRTFPLAKASVKCDLDVTLLTTDSKKGLGYIKRNCNDVKIVSVKDILPEPLIKRGFGLFSFINRIIYVLFHNFDYVYVDCGEALNAGWPAKIAQWKGATLLSEWGDLLGKGGFYDKKPILFKIFYGWYFLWAELYFRKSADYTVVLSSMMKQHAIKRGIDENKVLTIPGGAITDVISYGYASKRKIGLSDDIITLGYIGIDDGELKDLLPLITVLKQAEFKDRFRLVTFGKKLSEETINKYQLNDIIVNYGWLNFYEDYTASQCVDIYVLMKTTNIERSSMGWPNKLGDYMTIGRPIILNLYGDVKKFVAEHSKGFITVSLTEKSIKEELQKIVENKYNLKQMSIFNRDVAENIISWDARVTQMFRIINRE